MRNSAIALKANEAYGYVRSRMTPHIVFLALSLALLLVVFIVGVINSAWINSAWINDANDTPTFHTSPSLDFPGLGISTNATSFDARQLTFRIHLGFTPYGNLSDSTSDWLKPPSVPIAVIVDSQVLAFPAGMAMASHDLALTVGKGTPQVIVLPMQSYPFDSYQSTFYIVGQYANDSKRYLLREADSSRLPLSFDLRNAMPDWRILFKLTDHSNLLVVNIEFSRASNQKFFSIFIVILMWILTFAIMGLALNMCFYDLYIDSPTIVNCI